MSDPLDAIIDEHRHRQPMCRCGRGRAHFGPHGCLLCTPVPVNMAPQRRRVTLGDFASGRLSMVAGEDLDTEGELWLDLIDDRIYQHALPRRPCDCCGEEFQPDELRRTECSLRCYADIRGIDERDG